jgi:hypothetical protein
MAIRHAVIGFVAGTLTTAAVAGGAPDLWRVVERARDDARAVDQIAMRTRDREAGRALHDLALRLQDGLSTIEATLPPRRSRQEVDATELAGMVASLKAQSFESDRLKLLADMSTGRRFTSAQVVSIVGLFTFDEDKVDAAAQLYPLVSDPTSFWTVYDALSFSASKDALRARIGQSTPR